MKPTQETRKAIFSSDTEEGMIETRRRENDKQAAEYIRRLAKEEFPEMEVEVNYYKEEGENSG